MRILRIGLNRRCAPPLHKIPDDRQHQEPHTRPPVRAARDRAVSAALSRHAVRLARIPDIVVAGDVVAAARGARDDRSRLRARRSEHGQPQLHRTAGRCERDGDRHRRALLLRQHARRTRRRRHPPHAVHASAHARSGVLRTHARRRTDLAPRRRHRTRADRGEFEHVGRAAQRGHGDRRCGDAGRDQPETRRLRRARHPAGDPADRAGRTPPAETRARQSGSHRRHRRDRQRNTQRDVRRAGVCARAGREPALRRRDRAHAESRAAPRRATRGIDRAGDPAHLRRDHAGACGPARAP